CLVLINVIPCILFFFFFSSRRRHTRWPRDWSSDVCSSDLEASLRGGFIYWLQHLPCTRQIRVKRWRARHRDGLPGCPPGTRIRCPYLGTFRWLPAGC